MESTLLTVFGAVVVALITGIVTWAVARTNAQSSERNVTIPPYGALADRVTKLEVSDAKKSDKLQEQDQVISILRNRLTVVISDRDSLVAYVRQWNAWFMSGATPPPPPVPTHLRDLLDPDSWDVARITETTTTTTYATPPNNGGGDV
jgi:hypothetical protein